MQIKRFVFNPFQVNSYLLFDETKEAILIDAAMINSQEENSFADFISKNDLDLKALLNTHGHMDHIAGSNWIKRKYNISPQGHESDDILISSAEEFKLLSLIFSDIRTRHAIFVDP
jgi:glyoxylase-like metal-dependent hydrolase (beta-lactamase superfamily II)